MAQTAAVVPGVWVAVQVLSIHPQSLLGVESHEGHGVENAYLSSWEGVGPHAETGVALTWESGAVYVQLQEDKQQARSHPEELDEGDRGPLHRSSALKAAGASPCNVPLLWQDRPGSQEAWTPAGATAGSAIYNL